MKRFDPNEFSLLIIDEAHRGVAKGYQKIVNYYRQNPALKVLGVTATPVRSDKEALGQVFNVVAGQFPIGYGVEHGWLVDITQQFVSVSSLDLSNIHTVKGDFDQRELSALMETQPVIMGICQPSLEVLYGLQPRTLSDIQVEDWGDYLSGLNKPARKAIVFTASVFQAELFSNILNGAVPHLAEWICGKTPKEKRRESLERFEKGETRVLVNVACLTEGYNSPAAEVVLMARPTKSVGTYEQMVGRILRPLPGTVDGDDLETPDKRRASIDASPKPFARIIDFVGNSGRHKLVSCMDILGGKVSDDAIAKAKLRGVEDEKPLRVTAALANAEKELVEEKKRQRELEEERQQRTHSRLVAGSNFHFENVDPFDALNIRRATPFARGYGRVPSPKMAAFLARHGINVEKHRLTFTDAGMMIGKIQKMKAKAPASPGQRRVLERYGLPTGVTFTRAKEQIDELKSNGWKRLPVTT